ncbi:SDR family oxidoreductase [candidate division KSB1 bacterium]|nr:SDR family oxidoreductase [candidate division KSB1 bacterium]
MSNFLVTGGGGFIGSNIVTELLKQGHHVRVLDNFSTGRRQNLTYYLDRIDLIEGDLRSAGVVQQAVRDMDYVLHQGALPSVPRSIADPEASTGVNVTGTLNVLMAARDAKVKRVILASSSSIYGDIKDEFKVESMRPNPLSPYAVSKAAAEYYCQVFNKVYGLETVCLRYFNVFGLRQDPNSQYAAVIPKFIRAIRANKQPIIYGDGTQSRDFTYIENVVHANLLAADKENISGQIINIACGDSISLLQLVEMINKILRKDITPIFNDARAGDIKHSRADISKAKELLNYDVIVNFETGLRRTIEWYVETSKSPSSE